jgi:hypothetical protein
MSRRRRARACEGAAGLKRKRRVGGSRVEVCYVAWCDSDLFKTPRGCCPDLGRAALRSPDSAARTARRAPLSLGGGHLGVN